jgi:ABC-2 type transport system permease protein
VRQIYLVAVRELGSLLNTRWGATVLSLALATEGILFHALALGRQPRFAADVLADFFRIHAGITLVVVILVSMRLFAEERQTGTLVLLESSPLSDRQLVLGKSGGAMGFVAILGLLSVYFPVLMSSLGRLSIGHISTGYLGIWLVASAAVSAGTWLSCVSPNQVVAAISTTICLGFFSSLHLMSRVVDMPFRPLFAYVSFIEGQFAPFAEGKLQTEGIVFFGTLSFFFLLAATQSLCARRWI